MSRWTRDDLARARIESKNKFGAKKKVVDNITFDSSHEAEVYQGLKLRQIAGQITALQFQMPMRVEVNGHYVFTYICDFVYQLGGTKVYEDAKGYRKGAAYQLFRLKKAIIKAAMGIDIDEV